MRTLPGRTVKTFQTSTPSSRLALTANSEVRPTVCRQYGRAVGAVLVTWPRRQSLFCSGSFRMLTSSPCSPSAFLHCSRTTSPNLLETAGYDPFRTVVWQGSDSDLVGPPL